MSVLLLGQEWTLTSAQSLRLAMKHFRENAAEDTDALLNISEKKEVDAPRSYQYQEWPRMLYHADGRELLAFSAEEMADKTDLGFRKEPYIRPRVSALSPAEEKASADKRFSQMEELLRQQADTIARMQIAQETKAVKGKS